MEMLSNVLINLLSNYINDKFSDLKENYEVSVFLKQLYEWTKEFEQKYEGTVVATNRFCESIKNYKIVERIFEYVVEPGKNNLPESVFASVIKNEIIEAVRMELVITPCDEKLIINFIGTIINKTKAFLEHMIPLQIKKQSYDIDQISKKVDILIEKVNSYEGKLELKETYESTKIFSFEECKNIKELLTNAIELIANHTKTDYNQIILCSKISLYENGLVVYADNVSENKQRYRLVAQDGLIGKAFHDEAIIIVKNIEENELYFTAVLETKSEVVIPIVINNKTVGAINSESENVDFYSDKVVKELCILSEELGSALKRLNYRTDICVDKLPYVHI